MDKEVGAMEWSDGRLDELSKTVDDQGKRMDEGFARLDGKMDEGFARMDTKFEEMMNRTDAKLEQVMVRTDARFEQMMARTDIKFVSINERFDGMYRMLVKASWALVIGLLGVLTGTIAAQL